MRVQDYSPPKLTLGIVGVVAIIIPVLVGYFLISGLGTSSAYTSDFAGGTSTTSVVTSTGPVSTVAISIPNGAGTQAGAPGFAPDKVTVVIGVNSTVTWTNNDIAPHTVTANNQTGGVAVFDSANLAVGQSFTYNFTTPGTYAYHCNYHSWMLGTVVVKAGTASVKVSIPNGAGTQAGAPGFGPDVITVVIGVNNTVTWTNNDIAPHTVTANNQTAGVAVFDSSNLAVGASFTFTFTTPGIYLYHCNYHSWMIGTVKVVQG